MIARRNTGLRKSALKLFAAVLAGLAALPANAQPATAAYRVSVAGNQDYGDNLGLDFTVNAAVRIWGLGAFDSGGDGFSTDIFVGIYDLTNLAFIGPVVNFNGWVPHDNHGPGAGYYKFKPVTPFTLPRGTYSIVAWGFNGANPNYNTNIAGVNGASPIKFDSIEGHLTNGNSRYGGGANPENGTLFPYQSAFAAGTFAATIPEPATWGMFILGLGIAGAALRSRRKAAVQAALA